MHSSVFAMVIIENRNYLPIHFQVSINSKKWISQKIKERTYMTLDNTFTKIRIITGDNYTEYTLKKNSAYSFYSEDDFWDLKKLVNQYDLENYLEKSKSNK